MKIKASDSKPGSHQPTDRHADAELQQAIAGWRLLPNRCELWTDDGQVHRLQPRVMAVLQYLWQHANCTVNRQALLDEIWQGRTVGDDALNRCVYSLRKTLSQHPHINIVTIPKQGYVLEYKNETAQPREQEEVPETSPRRPLLSSPIAHLRNGKRYLWGLGLLLSIGLLVLIEGGSDTPLLPVLWQQAPVSSLPGWEIQPDVAPGGGQVVFAWREHQADDWDIFVQSLAGGELLPISDTWGEGWSDTLGDEQLPRWSPDGAQIAYVSYAEEPASTKRRCRIMLAPSSGGEGRNLADCDRARVQSMDWSPDGAGLLLTVRHHDVATAVWQWVAVDEAKQAPDLPELMPGQSVEDVRFDAQGSRLAYSISPALGVEDLYVFDIKTQQQRRISFDQLKIHGLDWSEDQQWIVAASNRSGPFLLWRYSISKAQPPQLVQSAQGDVDAPVSSTFDQVLYSARRSDANIQRRSFQHHEQSSTEIDTLVNSTRYEWDLQFSPDGRWLSFISDRSGHAELWLARADGSHPRQITHFNGAYTQSARWSPDSQQLVMSAPVNGMYRLFHYDLQQDQIQAITDGSANDQAPIWSLDGEWIYFSSTRASKQEHQQINEQDAERPWFLWRIRADGQDLQQSAVQAKAAQFDPDGRYVYSVRAKQTGLWRRSVAELWNPKVADELIVARLAPVDWNNWWVGREFVYFIERVGGLAPLLQRRALGSIFDQAGGLDGESGFGTQTLAEIPGLLYHSGLWLDEAQQQFFVSVVSHSTADLYRVYPAKRSGED